MIDCSSCLFPPLPSATMQLLPEGGGALADSTCLHIATGMEDFTLIKILVEHGKANTSLGNVVNSEAFPGTCLLPTRGTFC